MRASFAAAGFDRFVELYDRRTPGGTDPYELISRIGALHDRPYAILVHQDVRADQGVGASDLLAELERLDELDPRWFVAGNAGGASDLRLVRRLQDPYGGSTDDELPTRVVTLDENFLVLNRAHALRATAGLGGFHFYGSDVCLNAALDGGTAYVIDFPVTHLSGGKRGTSYDEAKDQFLAAWQRRLVFAYIRAPTEILFVSRYALARRFFGSERMLERVRNLAPSLRLDTDT